MSPELFLIIGSIVGGTGALLSFWAGWRARDLQGPPRGSYGLPRGYCSINYPDPSPGRRPTNPFNGEPVTFTESSVQRGNRNGGPTTPKPEIVPRGQRPGGYQPRPQQGTPNPPPREP